MGNTAKHPIYPREIIHIGAQGGMPTPGSFYAAKRGDSLTRIASSAYDSGARWRTINTNPWNMSVLVYRADSSSCSSKQVGSAKAPSNRSPSMPGAYISICVKDGKMPGYDYPVMWIPSVAKPMSSSSPQEQMDLVVELTPGMLPHVSSGTKASAPAQVAPVLLQRPRPKLDEGVRADTELATASMVPTALPWWAYIAVAGAAGVWVWKSKKKKKRK